MRATIRRTTGAGIRRINRTPTTAPEIDASASARYSDEDALWDEARAADTCYDDFRMAA